jgi:hypothetical protein
MSMNISPDAFWNEFNAPRRITHTIQHFIGTRWYDDKFDGSEGACRLEIKRRERLEQLNPNRVVIPYRVRTVA